MTYAYIYPRPPAIPDSKHVQIQNPRPVYILLCPGYLTIIDQRK